jgi:hypothetical protein
MGASGNDRFESRADETAPINRMTSSSIEIIMVYDVQLNQLRARSLAVVRRRALC